MLLVKDVEFHTVEAQFHEAVFTHASTSPNQQLIASLDVARRQMELEGYGLVHNAIEVALAIRQAVAEHPLISKYFHILGADKMVPAEYRQSGFTDYLDPKTNWAVARQSIQEDEFCLDPTRMTLVCGTAGYDGTQFKGISGEPLQHPDQQDLAKFSSCSSLTSTIRAAMLPISSVCWWRSATRLTSVWHKAGPTSARHSRRG